MVSTGKIVFEGKTAKGLDVLLRYPKRDDAPALLDYINSLSREQTFILFQGEQLTLDEEELYVEGQLAAIEAGSAVQLLAFANGTLAGNTQIGMHRGVSSHVCGLGIAVAQPFRGQGVGELLMNAIINEAITHLPALKIITLQVFGHNTVGINLYQKLGFIEYGRLPGGILHRGQHVDDVYMYKRVRD